VTVQTRALHYQADGLAMTGWLAQDDGRTDRRAGVLVFPAAPGLGTQVRDAAERLAGLGYVALGCDLYGGGRFFDDVDEALVLLAPLRTHAEGVRARAGGALAALAAQPTVDPARVAAIGYCFGGIMALELARGGADLAAVVGFHTPLRAIDPSRPIHIKGQVLICTGSEDREANLQDRAAFEAEMRQGGVDWRMSLYGGVYHSFTNPDADSYGKPDYARYNARAHARSWQEMLTLFDESLGPV